MNRNPNTPANGGQILTDTMILATIEVVREHGHFPSLMFPSDAAAIAFARAIEADLRASLAAQAPDTQVVPKKVLCADLRCMQFAEDGSKFCCNCEPAATLPAAPAPTEQADDYTLDDVDLARRLLMEMGRAIGPSREPGANRDVDRLATLIGANFAARQAPTPEAEEDAVLIDKLGKLLAGVAISLKGPEPALTRWSYHDLPEIAAKAMIELEIYRHRAGQSPDSRNAALEEAAALCDAQALEPECPERATYCADAIRALKGPAQ